MGGARSNRSRSRGSLVLVGAIAVASIAGCKVTGATTTSKLRVVTTVAPITSIAAAVAGDYANVQGIVPEGTNSHTFEPAPSVAARLSEADVIIVNGLDLEVPTLALAEQNLQPGAEILDLASRTITEREWIYDFSFPKEGGSPNPHLWTNPPYAKRFAQIIAQTLSRRDPQNREHYQRNAMEFSKAADVLDAAMVVATRSVPQANRVLLTYHDSFAYFAVHYGWKVLGAIQVSNFDDPSPRQVADLIRQIKRSGVPAIFGSEVFPSPVLAQIGQETGVRYVDTLRDDDLPGRPGEREHSWLGLLRRDFITMVRNLGGDPTSLERVGPLDTTRDHARYPQ